MSMVALQNNKILQHVVSTNVDGLHIRSGIQRNNVGFEYLVLTLQSFPNFMETAIKKDVLIAKRFTIELMT